MTKVPMVFCPKCKSKTHCTNRRHDGDFGTGLKLGRYRLCKTCQCEFSTVVEGDIERVDFILDQAALSDVADDVPVESIDEFEPEPELSDTWKDLHQMYRALFIGVRDNVKWFGRGGATGNEELTALAGQIRAARENGMIHKEIQPTWVIG